MNRVRIYTSSVIQPYEVVVCLMPILSQVLLKGHIITVSDPKLNTDETIAVAFGNAQRVKVLRFVASIVVVIGSMNSIELLFIKMSLIGHPHKQYRMTEYNSSCLNQ